MTRSADNRADFRHHRVVDIPKQITAAMAVLLCCASTAANAGDQADAGRCTAVAKEIAQIQERMRAGYTAAAGNRYEERLRKLKKFQYDNCRKR